MQRQPLAEMSLPGSPVSASLSTVLQASTEVGGSLRKQQLRKKNQEKKNKVLARY